MILSNLNEILKQSLSNFKVIIVVLGITLMTLIAKTITNDCRLQMITKSDSNKAENAIQPEDDE